MVYQGHLLIGKSGSKLLVNQTVTGRALIDLWVSLTEERNAVLVPAAGNGIPGALADW